MIERLILHIGTHRTGSTALQQLLHLNSERLAQAGVLYPIAGRGGSNPENHHVLALSLAAGHPGPRRQLREELQRSDATVAVVSSEVFNETDTVPLLAEALEGLPVEIVAYLRRQDVRVESWYRQIVKDAKRRHTELPGIHTSPEGYSPNIEYAGLLDRYRRLDPVRFHVLPYHEGADPTDVYRQFLDVLGVEWDEGFSMPGPALRNHGLKRDFLEVKRLANRTRVDVEDDLTIARALTRLSLAAPSDPVRFLLPPAYRALVLSWYEDSNSAVAQEFLGRDTLFDLPASQEEWEPYRGLEEELRDQIILEMSDHGPYSAPATSALTGVDPGLSTAQWARWWDRVMSEV